MKRNGVSDLPSGTYYDTRSEKVLEYLAEKNLGDIVDGHPRWRKLILNTFNDPMGLIKWGARFKRWKNYALITAILLLGICIAASYGSFRWQDASTFDKRNIWIWSMMVMLFIFLVGWIIRIVYMRLLYWQAERLGINPGDDFQNWINEILLKNGVGTVSLLKKKIENEQLFNPDYKPGECKEAAVPHSASPVFSIAASAQTQLPDSKQEKRYTIEEILSFISNNSISLDFVSRQINLLYPPDDVCKKVELDDLMPAIVTAFEQRTLNAKGLQISGPGTITREIVIVSSDLSNEIKVEFPGMHRMYWGDNYNVSPAEYVRASMSVPFFFKPFTVTYEPNQIKAIRDEWSNYSKVYKELGETAMFVDGGVLSNFPINVFNDPTIPLPRKPTIGVRLEYNNQTTADPIKSLSGFALKMVSTMRFFYDRDFITKNSIYRKTVRSVDTGKISWLNFGLTNQQEIELFFRGALTAAIFLARQCCNEEEIETLRGYGNTIVFKDAPDHQFSMYPDKKVAFRTEDLDKLLGDLIFNWKKYKQDRIRAIIDQPAQKNNLKTQASTTAKISKDA